MGIFKLNGILGKKPALVGSLINLHLESVNLKAVKSIVAAYDPFDQRSISTRNFVGVLRNKAVVQKFPDFKVETTIKCDRSEPTVTFDLSKKVVFKASRLTALEMLELYNQHITPHAPVEEVVQETLQTKAMRKGR